MRKIAIVITSVALVILGLLSTIFLCACCCAAKELDDMYFD